MDTKTREGRQSMHEWHVALNKFNSGRQGGYAHWMYEAKNLANESKRLEYLFRKEREGCLPKTHRQCSLSAPEKVEDNHLTCCLGVKCRECEFLTSLDKAKAPPADIDQMKAWTCASHILHECGKRIVDTSEGYVLTTADRMFWDNVYESLSMGEQS